MIVKNIDGKEVQYVLYQFCSARVDDIYEHEEIFPSEDYWESRIGLSQVQLFDEEAMKNPQIKLFNDLRIKYWVPKSLLAKALMLGEQQGIGRPDIDNLLLIVRSFKLYAMNMEGEDILDYAEDFRTMEKLQQRLGENVNNILKVKVTVGRLIHLNPREHIEKEDFKFENERFLDPLQRKFEDWMKTDSFKELISDNYPWASEAIGYHQKIKLTKDTLYLLVYWYIIDHDLATSHFDACKKAGLFFSLVPDIVNSRQDWENDTSAGGSHVDYETYIGNVMRMKIKRASKNVSEQKKSKT